VIPLRDANPTRRVPVVSVGLIAASSAVFIYELILESTDAGAGLTSFFTQFGVLPVDVTAAFAAGDVVSAAGLSLLTSQFLHAGWLHLLGNMLYLWIFGNNIEDRLGRPLFILFYLAGGAIAALAQVAIEPRSTVPLVGASGAISATLGAYLVLYPRARVLSLVFLGFFYQLVEVPALFVLGFWFIFQLIDGFLALGAPTSVEGGVAFFAHIGGFVAGALVALPLRAGARHGGPRSAGWGVG
jgi:membrane associated rhomboid family serine protease